MNEHQTLVRDFHAKFGLTINDAPTLSPSDDRLRVNLIHEEAMELWEAEEKRDRVAIADALGDLAYVIYGAGVTYGVEVSGGECGEEMAYGFLRGAAELCRATAFDTREIQRELCILICGVEAATEYHIIPLDPVFREIHRSNLTKLWTTEEVIESFGTERSVEERAGGWVITEAGGGKWCVKRHGKVIKSPSYSPANLGPILATAP